MYVSVTPIRHGVGEDVHDIPEDTQLDTDLFSKEELQALVESGAAKEVKTQELREASKFEKAAEKEEAKKGPGQPDPAETSGAKTK